MGVLERTGVSRKVGRGARVHGGKKRLRVLLEHSNVSETDRWAGRAEQRRGGPE